MSDPNTVLPVFPEASHLRVQASSKLAFGATTAALVTLASGGTALVVNHGTSAMTTATSLPSGSLLQDVASASSAVVVDRAPGSYLPPAPVIAGETEQALRSALAERPPVGRRTLTAPLVLLPGFRVPAPVVQVPFVQVPFVEVAPVEVPAVPVPDVGPGVPIPRAPHLPTASPAKPVKGEHLDTPVKPAKQVKQVKPVTPVRADQGSGEHESKGKHRGRQHHESRAKEQDQVPGKHARAGRHAR